MQDRKKLERIVRGFSNHRRIQLLDLLERRPELSVQEAAGEVRTDYRTVADHLRRLTIAGLIMKRNHAQAVRHALTDRGRRILMFLRTLE